MGNLGGIPAAYGLIEWKIYKNLSIINTNF